MVKRVTYKVVSIFMVILMMTLPTFPLLAKFERVKSTGTYIRSASTSASSMKKLSILLTQMIEEIREDEHTKSKTKGKDTGKEIIFTNDRPDFRYYLGTTTHPGASTCSILNGHEQDILLPPEFSC